MKPVIEDQEIYDAWVRIKDPYERLYYIAKHLVKLNTDATFYDLFNCIRQSVFSGMPYDEESDFIRNIDNRIEYENGHSRNL